MTKGSLSLASGMDSCFPSGLDWPLGSRAALSPQPYEGLGWSDVKEAAWMELRNGLVGSLLLLTDQPSASCFPSLGLCLLVCHLGQWVSLNVGFIIIQVQQD